MVPAGIEWPASSISSWHHAQQDDQRRVQPQRLLEHRLQARDRPQRLEGDLRAVGVDVVELGDHVLERLGVAEQLDQRPRGGAGGRVVPGEHHRDEDAGDVVGAHVDRDEHVEQVPLLARDLAALLALVDDPLHERRRAARGPRRGCGTTRCPCRGRRTRARRCPSRGRGSGARTTRRAPRGTACRSGSCWSCRWSARRTSRAGRSHPRRPTGRPCGGSRPRWWPRGRASCRRAAPGSSASAGVPRGWRRRPRPCRRSGS